MSDSTTILPSSTPLEAARRESSVPSALHVGRWAAADQIVFSAANFLMAVLLGRYAGSHELGEYAVAMAVIHLVTATQRALVSSPYTYLRVHTKGRRRDFSRGSALVLATLISSVAAILVAICAVALTSMGLASVSGACAFALFAWGMRDFCRRLMFADQSFREAALLDVSVVLLHVTFMFTLLMTSQLNATNVLISLGVACGVVTVIWLFLRQGLFMIHCRRVFRDLGSNWKFGRWGALSEINFALQDVGVQAILALCAGLSATGIYAASMSLVRLANPLIHAVSNAVGPLSARALQAGGIKQLSNGVRRVTKLMSAAMILYVLFFVLAGRSLLALIYGEEYQQYASILVPLTISTALVALALAPSKAISALRIPRLNFWSNLASLLVTLALAWGSFELFGVYGVAFSVLVGSLIAAVFKWWFYFQLVRPVSIASER